MAHYGRQALLARKTGRERGFVFIELSCLTKGIGAGGAANPWDQHGKLEDGHRAMAHQVDQPIGALIGDLKQRGLLDSTLFGFHRRVWSYSVFPRVVMAATTIHIVLVFGWPAAESKAVKCTATTDEFWFIM